MIQPLLVLGSLDVWGRVTSGTGGKFPSTLAAAFYNKAYDNENSCGMECTSCRLTPISMHDLTEYQT
jgi:hypothetical protein